MPTLLQVWSFDERLTNKDKENLLIHFGAESVEHIRKHGRDMAVLACFRKEEDCEYAMKKLHQQKVLGRRLMAAYKESSVAPSYQPHRNEGLKANKPPKEEVFKNKLAEFEAHLSAAAANFDIKHPIPPYLKYLYPPPSASIMAHIVQTLLAVPKFYTQVLHLMNKMNLPTPFGNLRIIPSQFVEILKQMDIYSDKKLSAVEEPIETLNGNEMKVNRSESEVSETESELESDNEESASTIKPAKPVKRRMSSKKIINKRPNFELLKQTCVPHPRHTVPSVSEAFDNPESLQSRRLELRLTGILPSDANVNPISELEPGGFGKLEVVKVTQEKSTDNPVEWKGESTKYISKEELLNNKISKADWPIVPVFKNYKQGEPSTKLYIKNLAKTTTEAQLKHIYGGYVFWHNEEEVSLFSIRLMKEGRMKGQAFVTFPSVEKASEALNDTNGYILNDKPMVIAFGKVKSS